MTTDNDVLRVLNHPVGVGEQPEPDADRARRDRIVAMLHRFARQRPGLEFCNYGDAKAYRAEMRSITKDLAHAQILLRRIELSGITSAELEAAFSAYSGRLVLEQRADGKLALSYCTGQYWPTEYRRAVCAVASAALWTYTREHCMPSGPNRDGDRYWSDNARSGKGDFIPAGTWLRNHFKREFGRGIANAWFQ
jgi:hypothetical protein